MRHAPAARVRSRLARWLGGLALAALVAAGGARAADDGSAAANRQFVDAMRLIRQADSTYDPAEEARLLREADALLAEIAERHPESPLAVQLVTNQFIGDFDVYEFRNRVKSLVCTEPLSSACFLHRVETLLPPVEHPIATARWDWLSLAVAYDRLGSPDRARTLIAPFLSAARRSIPTRDGYDDLFVARALALTGQIDLALELTRRFPSCATRIYNLTDIAEAAQWHGQADLAARLVQEASDYASRRSCTWELGLVAQGLLKVGREAEARTLFLNTVEQQFSRFRETKGDCCPPELALAAAELGDINLALGLLRTVQDSNPWTVPAVLGRLARRGETALTQAYAEQVDDVDLRAETYAELVEAAVARGDRDTAEEMMGRLRQLSEQPDQGEPRPIVLAELAEAEWHLNRNDEWRGLMARAIGAAEAGSAYVRGDIGVPLLATLVEIETGRPLLD